MNEAAWEALSALGLGMLTTVQPCPLTTNIAALTLICARSTGIRRPLLIGLAFMLGIVATYVTLGILLVLGALSTPAVANLLQDYMNRLLGPLLILVGMLLTGLIPASGHLITLAMVGDWMRERSWGMFSSFALGAALALSFCPSTAALFFGTLIPLALKHNSYLLAPSLYGVGAGLPLFVLVILLLKGVQLSGARWAKRFQRVAGVLLIGLGMYFVLHYVYQVV